MSDINDEFISRFICSEYDFAIPEKADEEGSSPLSNEYCPYKVFINGLDSYHGRHISKFIATQTVGGLSEKQVENVEEVTQPEETTTDDRPPRTIEVLKEADEHPKYLVIGTSKSKIYEKPPEIAAIVDDECSSLLTVLLSCKYIIYDISEDSSQIKDVEWAIQALDEEMDKQKEAGQMIEPRNFILISTVLSWALTKPLDPDEPDEPFSEDDYRLRRAHINYKNHLVLEKEVIRIGKKHRKELKTIVIGSGLVYGLEENLLRILFKLAWLHEPLLPYFASSKNNVPLLHIKDLSNIIYHLLESMPRKRWYILALEETVSTLKEIVKAISVELGSGKVTKITKELAFALKDMNEGIYDHMTMNLNMTPEYILENMALEFVPDDNEMNFLENIESITADFVQIHGLKPIKLYIHGPPMSGKTFLAHKICRHYQLHYLCLDNIIKDFITEMKGRLKEKKERKTRAKQPRSHDEDDDSDDDGSGGDESDDADESDEEDETEQMELFESLKEAEAKNVEPDEDIIIKIVKEKLRSKPCQKQGYVLDGYPETYEQAKKLFSLSEDDEEDDDEDEEEQEEDDEVDEVPIPVEVNKKIMPDHIFNLQAENTLLFKRALKVSPERNINGRYDEENMARLLTDFRILNTDATTVMNFFDEVEHYPKYISVMDDERPLLEKAFQNILTIIGNPSYIEPPEDEEEKMSEEEKALIRQQKEEERREQLEKELQERIERRIKMEEWAKQKLNMKQEDQRSLKAKTIPIRDYLLKEVFPFLKDGLKEIYRMKPNDPVDYLAEYLFTNYIDGKFFPPKPKDVSEDQLFAALHIFKCFDRQ